VLVVMGQLSGDTAIAHMLIDAIGVLVDGFAIRYPPFLLFLGVGFMGRIEIVTSHSVSPAHFLL
jgi:hypothetical protein